GAFELLKIELRPREWRYRHGRRQYQVIVAETRLETPENSRLLGVGPGHVCDGHVGRHLIIGAHVGAERGRAFRVRVATAVEVAWSQNATEETIGLAEIEFPLVTGAEKVPPGCDPTAEDTPDLRADRALTKIFCKRHAQPAEIDRPRGRNRDALERERQ